MNLPLPLLAPAGEEDEGVGMHCCDCGKLFPVADRCDGCVHEIISQRDAALAAKASLESSIINACAGSGCLNAHELRVALDAALAEAARLREHACGGRGIVWEPEPINLESFRPSGGQIDNPPSCQMIIQAEEPPHAG